MDRIKRIPYRELYEERAGMLQGDGYSIQEAEKLALEYVEELVLCGGPEYWSHEKGKRKRMEKLAREAKLRKRDMRSHRYTQLPLLNRKEKFGR